MNNKGITLVELIISFALLMVVVIGMLSVIMNVRTNYNDKRFLSEMLDYKTTMTYTIEKDLIKKGFTSLSDCTFGTNEISECKIITFKDGTTAELRINLKTGLISYGGVNYPITNFDFIEFLDARVISIEQNYNVEIKVSGNYLIINVPYFEIDKDINYGFKIIHPISL